MYLNRFCYLLLIFAAVGSIFTSHPVAMWFLLANVLTLAIHGIDKTAARKPAQSAGIHFVGVWGCRWVAGAIVGQQLFRHKTQKQPFKTYFIVSVIVSILVTVAIYRLYPFCLTEHRLCITY